MSTETKLEVIDTVNRFFLAVDTRDYTAARALLTDDVDFDAGAATCRSNYIAHHWFPNPQGDVTWAVGGRYHHRLVLTGGLWKLQGGVIEVAWTKGNRAIFDLARASAAKNQ